MTDLPIDTYYGKAVGRFLLAVPDGADPESFPDPDPMQGEVIITPLQRVYKNPNPNATVVAPVKVVCTLDAEGNLRDPQGELGVWLVEGEYKVKYVLTNARIPTHRLTVTRLNDAMHPVNLRGTIPPVGPVATPGQYAELSSRIDTLAEFSPIKTVNGQMGDVVLTASDVDAYSKTEIDIQYDVIEAADAAETAARISGDNALSARITTLEENPVVPDLTSALASEASTRAAADSALSSRVTTLESSAPDLSSFATISQLEAEETMRASADSALSSRVTTLENAVPDLSGYATDAELSAEATARANADTNLDTRLAAVEAAPPGAPDLTDELAAETSARISADNALDTRLDTLESAPLIPDLTDELAAETSARVSSDNALDTRLDAVEARPVPDVTAANLEAHRVDTTDVHGIADTTALVVTTDSRLSDARTPTAHTHDDRYYTETEIDGQMASVQTALDARLKVSDNVIHKSVSITAAAYAALGTKDANTLYLIIG